MGKGRESRIEADRRLHSLLSLPNGTPVHPNREARAKRQKELCKWHQRRKRVKKVGRLEATKDATLLLELAIARLRANGLADEETKACIRGALEKAKQEIANLEEHDDARASLGLVLGGRSITDTEWLEAQG
jgi:hypothetical protein